MRGEGFWHTACASTASQVIRHQSPLLIVNPDTIIASLKRQRPAQATPKHLREVRLLQDYARTRLTEGTATSSISQPGRMAAVWQDPQATREPMGAEERSAWQRVLEAATAEVEWAEAQLPAKVQKRK